MSVMRAWRTWAISAAIGLVALGGVAWLNRDAILLAVIANTGKNPNIAAFSPPAWAQAPAGAPAPLDTRPPNIIFILADDLGINDITAFGTGVANGAVPTTAIDALAKSGAVFRQAYSGTASCAPSRAMIMTGRYPTRTGFEFTPTPDGMGRVISALARSDQSGLPPIAYRADIAAKSPPFAEQGLPGDEVTIAEVLRARGYYTAHIGKWHTGFGKEFGPNAQGFDDALVMMGGLHLPENDPNVVNARLDFDPIDKFLWARMEYANSFNNGPWFKPGGYLTDYWTDEAVRVIRANKSRPFFLNLAHWGVHTPLQATRADYEAVGDIKPHHKRVYAAMVRALDRSVGRILQTLEEEGLSQNTIVVFSSDNGAPGYIGIDGLNAPFRGWKLTLFEGGLRVPLLVKWPARITPGAIIEDPVGHIDLMPTLASMAGAAPPADRPIDGVDLSPRLALGAPPMAERALFWQSGYYRSVRQGDWKLQISSKPDRVWLFNLRADPTEQTNLAAQAPSEVARLRALLDAHQAGARPPLYPYVVEGPIAVDKTLAEKTTPADEVIFWPN